MKWLDRMRGTPTRSAGRVAGRISDDPQIVNENGFRYLVFHMFEAPDLEFRLQMSPMTPRRHRGDLVEVSYISTGGAATVEALIALPDEEAAQRRRREYLARLREQDGPRDR